MVTRTDGDGGAGWGWRYAGDAVLKSIIKAKERRDK